MGYILELEKISTEEETIKQVVGQAKLQASDTFELDRYMHGFLARRICQDDEDSKTLAITTLREFYEAKFIEFAHDQD